MNNCIRITAVLAAFVLLSGCLGKLAGVRQSDLDAWRGVPVKALDLHSLFSTMKLERAFTDDGHEVRNYKNEGSRLVCAGFSCVTRVGGCNSPFIIHEGYVVEYRPTGYGGAKCYTDETTRPEGVWVTSERFVVPYSHEEATDKDQATQVPTLRFQLPAVKA